MPGFDPIPAPRDRGDEPRPVPRHTGITDVRRLESATGQFRALDYRFGGGSCRDAVLAMASWADRIPLQSTAADAVRDRLLVAMADLHNLAAWTCFDTGMPESARYHFERALELATLAGKHDLAANILYRTGRVHLHHEAWRDALQAFQRGQTAAERAGSDLSVAILCANEAWAHAKIGDRDQALERLGHARDAFDRADRDSAPAWAAFFDEIDLAAITGVIYTDLARTVDPAYTAIAIPSLTRAISEYPTGMTRSRALSQIALSMNHLFDGDYDQAARVGIEAVDSSEGVMSLRTKDRMRPLRDEANRHWDNAHVRDLVDRITRFAAAS
jgi:tetratricopeptide (TPR) repeat protein